MSAEQLSPEFNYVRPRLFSVRLLTALLVATLCVIVYEGLFSFGFPDFSFYSIVILGIISLISALLILPRYFIPGFLITVLPFLICWRIAAMLDVTSVMFIATITFIYIIMLFFDAMRNDWVHAPQNGWFGHLEWQMTSLRIYFGFDMVGHFTEKLFAGEDVFQHMTGVFESLGLSNAGLFVLTGGLAELGIAIGLGMGLLTRLASVAAAIYFLIANHFGNHFMLGFTWANPGGGWEYPMLMVFFYLSFVLTGAGKFSLDAWLLQRGLMPQKLMILCQSKGHR